MNVMPMAAHEKRLRQALERSPANWELRKQLAHLLYDQEMFLEAAEVIWETDEIPSIDMELAFAARILAKAAPRKSIRLLSALLEHNRGKAAQNLGMANALLHHGMVLQALRFYGAALEADPSLCNPDLEHFMLWIDDQETLWGDFKNRGTKLGELPWMKRDPQEAMKLTQGIRLHTTPVRLPGLSPAPGEELTNTLYQQTAELGANPSPPPAVTIPMDRVAPQHRRFDSRRGAVSNPWAVVQEMPEPQFPAPVLPQPEPVASFVVTPAPHVNVAAAPTPAGVPISRGRKLQLSPPSANIRLMQAVPPTVKGS
jgi:hypothetical protein